MEHTKTKQRILLLLTGLAAVACVAFIWGNSLLPATQSAQASRSVLDVLNPLLELLHIPTANAHHLIRKMAHMSEFALLGLLWTALLLQIKQIHLSAALALAGCFALLVALTDETIQLFSPGRGSQVTDVWIDFAGACLGILLAWILRWLRIHVQSKHAKKHGSFRD